MEAASLGSATGSRVDSAARHTMPCKVNGKYFLGTIENIEDGENELNQKKDKYAMMKDEIVMNPLKKLHAVTLHTHVLATIDSAQHTSQRHIPHLTCHASSCSRNSSSQLHKLYQQYLYPSTRPHTPYCTIPKVTSHTDTRNNSTWDYHNPRGKQLLALYASQQKQEALLAPSLPTSKNVHNIRLNEASNKR